MTKDTDIKFNNLPSYLDKKYRRLLLYARISTLALLNYYEKDGLTYQDIKDALKLEDGSLGPNLSGLKRKGYIQAEDTKVGDKTFAVYYITDEGKKAYLEVRGWLNNLINLSSSEKTV